MTFWYRSSERCESLKVTRTCQGQIVLFLVAEQIDAKEWIKVITRDRVVDASFCKIIEAGNVCVRKTF